MKNILIFLWFAFLSIHSSIAQPLIQWQKCIGGSDRDEALVIQQTSDSGYVVGGWTMSNDGDVTNLHGDYDYWVVKLNSLGDTLWQKTLGGTGYNYGISLQQTIDSGYVVAGYTTSNDMDVTGNNGSYDYWIVKLTGTGVIQWQKCYGGSHGEFAQSIRQTADEGYILAGYSDSNDSDVTYNQGHEDCWIVKLNSVGDTLWQRTFGGSENDRATSIQQTSDNGYIFAGHSNSVDGDITVHHGLASLSTDCWVVKLDSNGVMQWQKSLGGTDNDIASSVQQTFDNCYIVAGTSESIDGDVTGNHGSYDYWVVKLNNTGDTLWQKSFGGTANDNATSVQQTSDSGYVIAGYTSSNNGDVTGHQGGRDNWIVKLNSSGIMEWQKSLGGTGDDRAFSIAQTIDEGYVIAGPTTSNNGDVTGLHGTIVNNDYWVVKLSPVILEVEKINRPISDMKAFPNPVSGSTVISFSSFQSENITVSAYDLTGRLIAKLFDGNLNAGVHQINWNVTEKEGADCGVYLLKVSGRNFSETFKLVVVK